MAPKNRGRRKGGWSILRVAIKGREVKMPLSTSTKSGDPATHRRAEREKKGKGARPLVAMATHPKLRKNRVEKGRAFLMRWQWQGCDQRCWYLVAIEANSFKISRLKEGRGVKKKQKGSLGGEARL